MADSVPMNWANSCSSAMWTSVVISGSVSALGTNLVANLVSNAGELGKWAEGENDETCEA